jgi:hypothetical protein
MSSPTPLIEAVPDLGAELACAVAMTKISSAWQELLRVPTLLQQTVSTYEVLLLTHTQIQPLIPLEMHGKLWDLRTCPVTTHCGRGSPGCRERHRSPTWVVQLKNSLVQNAPLKFGCPEVNTQAVCFYHVHKLSFQDEQN